MKNTQENRTAEARRVLHAACLAWTSGEELRRARRRNKDFTYGRQWNDLTTDIDGNPITEGMKLRGAGKEPVTNNMMRQMVKSVVGRFRNMLKEEKTEQNPKLQKTVERNLLDELDSRCLEEFLISGCCIQRVDRDFRVGKGIRVDNVNLNDFFVNAIRDPRSWDCEIVGQLHDLSLAELIMRTGTRGNRKHAARLREIYCNSDTENAIADFTSRIGANNEINADF